MPTRSARCRRRPAEPQHERSTSAGPSAVSDRPALLGHEPAGDEAARADAVLTAGVAFEQPLARPARDPVAAILDEELDDAGECGGAYVDGRTRRMLARVVEQGRHDLRRTIATAIDLDAQLRDDRTSSPDARALAMAGAISSPRSNVPGASVLPSSSARSRRTSVTSPSVSTANCRAKRRSRRRLSPSADRSRSKSAARSSTLRSSRRDTVPRSAAATSTAVLLPHVGRARPHKY